MKNFKTILKENKLYTIDEMNEWCYKNIRQFVVVTDSNKGNNAFKFDRKTQTVFHHSGYDLEIVTFDTFLPFKFYCETGIDITAPNLTDFSVSYDLVQDSNKHTINMSFNTCGKLNFSSNNLISDNTKISVLSFIEMSNIEPQNVINLNLMELVFVKCNNEKIYDFSNYSNIQTTYFTIKMDGMKELSNVSYLIENDDVKIQEFEIIKNHTRLSELCYIINEFVGLDDKKETIMDFTLRMIDNGFEDML